MDKNVFNVLITNVVHLYKTMSNKCKTQGFVVKKGGFRSEIGVFCCFGCYLKCEIVFIRSFRSFNSPYK